MRIPRLLLLLLLVPAVLHGGEVATGAGELRFVERFRWAGDHAATTGDHGTTVWWDAHTWDVRNDTSLSAVAGPGKGFHVDIHRAASESVSDGRISNAHAMGGDGSPGIGIMHVDHHGIASARLRNPMLIAPGRPGVVTFWAPRFQTAAHWWQVAVTPTGTVVGGEHTSVPSLADPLESPLQLGAAGTAGPGRASAEDSVNFIATGYPGAACDWRVRFGVRSTIGGVSRSFVTKQQSAQELMQTSPAERDELQLWRLEFHPDRVVLSLQVFPTWEFEEVDSFPVTIPWPEVYVHLLAAAYPAQEACGQAQVREFQWRDVEVEPVRYAATVVAPRDREAGWMAFDLRDTQRFGAEQPNPAPYDRFLSFAYCRGGVFCMPQTQRIELAFDRPLHFGVLARAQLLYDVRGSGATLWINGTRVGVLPDASTVAGAAGEEWVHRSIDVPPALLRPGANALRIELDGVVQLDRLQMELAYDRPAKRRVLGVR